MDKDTITEYYRMVDTLNLVKMSMNYCADKNNALKYDSINTVITDLLDNMRRFGINHIGCLEE